MPIYLSFKLIKCVVSVEVTLSPSRAPPAPASKRESLASPPRQRRGLKPRDVVLAEEAEAEAQLQAQEAEEEARKQSSDLQNDLPRVVFPSCAAQKEGSESVLAGLRQKILEDDRESGPHLSSRVGQGLIGQKSKW